jgi:hypothetical protein
MNTTPEDPLRDRLLDQCVPEPARLAGYRKEVQAMLEREERRLRIEKWVGGLLWVWVVVLGTAFALVAGYASDKPVRVYFSLGITLVFLLVYGAVELLKYFIHRASLEIRKDLKGLELRILELEGSSREPKR